MSKLTLVIRLELKIHSEMIETQWRPSKRLCSPYSPSLSIVFSRETLIMLPPASFMHGFWVRSVCGTVSCLVANTRFQHSLKWILSLVFSFLLQRVSSFSRGINYIGLPPHLSICFGHMRETYCRIWLQVFCICRVLNSVRTFLFLLCRNVFKK